jgi:phosphoesterase RecJ-like protein
MRELTRRECADWLLDRDRFLILTHRKPDGDTVGSSAALCRGLRQLGKQAWLLENPEFTPLLLPLTEGLTKAAPEEGDILVAVDVAADTMLPKAFSELKNSIDLRIDHHGSGREYSPNELVESDSASCAEIIWELLLDLGAELDPEMADAIYVGVSTDTGCFRYANTTAHTFDAAADCLAAGADVFGWNSRIFETNSLAKLRLQGWVVEHAKFFCDGKVALCSLPKAVEEGFGVDEDDMSNISSFLRSIEGVVMAALLREVNETNTKVSVRAIPGYDAAYVRELFEGGGHSGAAGCSIRTPLMDAEKAMTDALVNYMEA